MKSSLDIIVDTSGSMSEMGKIHLQRNLCRYVTQLPLLEQGKYTDVDIHFYQWAKDIVEIVVQNDGDVPVLEAKGSSSLSALSDFLLKKLNEIDDLGILILSDGSFEREDHKSFMKWKEKHDSVFIRTVAVGADADLLKLKKISTDNSVYLSENIASVIESTIFGTDEHMNAPKSTAQILQSEPNESAEPEENWDA